MSSTGGGVVVTSSMVAKDRPIRRVRVPALEAACRVGYTLMLLSSSPARSRRLSSNAVPDRPHHKIWPRRLPRQLVVPATTLWFNVEVAATRYPDKAAYLFFGKPLTYAELRRQAEAIAGWL